MKSGKRERDREKRKALSGRRGLTGLPDDQTFTRTRTMPSGLVCDLGVKIMG